MAIPTTPASGGTTVAVVPTGPTFLGHPAGLFLLFMVEMWERFSYYGMRALLVLYLVKSTNPAPDKGLFGEFVNAGRGWSKADASTLYGIYTGMAYLLPVLGGIIADRFIGTHRSMIVGGLIIALGHIVLAVSGWGGLGQSGLGMALFIFGLALIVIGTGHFKPSVSVMVGQLYSPDDPRRDGAFSIFYMGINVGAFVCAFICGTLGELVGWHWGFGSAAVGMLLGLGLYLLGRPKLLRGIGDPPAGVPNFSPLFLIGGSIIAAACAAGFHYGLHKSLAVLLDPVVGIVLFVLSVVAATVFTALQKPGDRGPVATIFIFMLFNAFFWIAFEQAGSSINLFTDEHTNRTANLPQWLRDFGVSRAIVPSVAIGVVGLVMAALSFKAMFEFNRRVKYPAAVACLVGVLVGLGLVTIGTCKALGYLDFLGTFTEFPTTWFQSVNPLLIILLAPLFGIIWIVLARHRANPSQPVKIALGLILLGLGYVILVLGAISVKTGVAPAVGAAATTAAKVGMIYVIGTYFLHTLGELCLSPTGLSYVTKAAPKRFVSLLMGIWFISSFIANLGGGLIAAQVEAIEQGKVKLPWNFGGQADYFFLFVVSSIGAGVLILLLTPVLKMLMRNPND